MKKIGIIGLGLALILSVNTAKAEGFHVPSGVQGMVTGALLGSVFGPNKKVRAKNAVIGAVSGYLIGDQYGKAKQRNSNRSNRSNRWERENTYEYPTQKTLVITPPQPRRVVVYRTPPSKRYWQETRTIYSSSSYYGGQTIIIEREIPAVSHQSNRRKWKHKRYRKNRRHHQRGKNSIY
jgi:hypothetical protein